MTVDGVAAANAMLAAQTWRAGYCLEAVWTAYKRAGARTDRTAATAFIGWERSDDKHPGDRNPPAGVPVWWGPKRSSNAGDVVISLGGGRVVATDWPRAGVIGITTIDQRERQIGRPYLGWTGDILGAPILHAGTAGTPAPPTQSEEDDMSQAAELAIFQIRDFLGANGGLNTKTPDTIGARVKDVQLALTNALPVLLTKSAATADAAAIAKAVVDAIPDDIAQDVIDRLGERLLAGKARE